MAYRQGLDENLWFDGTGMESWMDNEYELESMLEQAERIQDSKLQREFQKLLTETNKRADEAQRQFDNTDMQAQSFRINLYNIAEDFMEELDGILYYADVYS
jgi:ferritin-like metal-binding protein YciE